MTDIEKALQIIEEGTTYSSNNLIFAPTYFVTNEDIDSYIKFMNIDKGNVLTVVGSGDQIFNSVLNGAKNIDAFDMNKMSYYIYELRRAAILTLSMEEYQKFYPINITASVYFNDFFDIKLYNKLRMALSSEAQYFWDYLYDYYYLIKCDNFGLVISNLCCNKSIKSYKGNYFEIKEKYNLLKSRLMEANVRYYYSNLLDLPEEIRSRKSYYDGVILSNVFDWLEEDSDIDVEEFFYSHIDSLLKEDSISMVHYDVYNNEFFGNMNSIEIGYNIRAYLYKKKLSKQSV